MDFIDDYKFACLGAQEGVSILQAATVDGTFEIEVQSAMLALRGDLPGQRGFADLARSKQHDSGHVAEAVLYDGSKAAS